MTKVVAITGGIGAGKTTISSHLKKKGYLVHESDKAVSQMYINPNKSFQNFIKKNLSEDLAKKNKLNKKSIANFIFNNQEAKNKLEKYIHKKVQRSREKFIQKNTKPNIKIIFVDIPLLF